ARPDPNCSPLCNGPTGANMRFTALCSQNYNPTKTRATRMNTISDKLNRSWQLFKRSVLVIRENPKLLIFPIVIGLLTLAIALFFLAPVGLMFAAPHLLGGTKIQGLVNSFGFLRFHQGTNIRVYLQPLGTAILAGIYLVNMFLATMSSV